MLLLKHVKQRQLERDPLPRYVSDTSSNAAKRILASKRERRPLVAEHEGKEHVPKKVARKRRRYECSADGCTNHSVKGGVCIRHGAKVNPKKCSSEGCTNFVVNRGVCIKHGAKFNVKRCSSEGCTNKAKQGGVCKWHGAKVKVKRCSSEGCTNIALKGRTVR